MGKCATGQTSTLTLAQLLVVCTLLTLWGTTLVGADECGTKFTDPTSSAVLAQVVMQGTIGGMNPMPGHTGRHSANITVGKVYKGMDVLRRVSPAQDMVMVSEFGQEDKDRCVASAEAMDKGVMHIFFLRQTSDRRLLQMSAMPLPMEQKMERRVRRSLCDTCVRPPRIKRMLCKNCAKEPKMKDMKPKKVKIGRRARLRCVARGKPAPTFTWQKGGLPIVSGSGGTTIKTTASSSTLIIRRFTLVYKGLYTCTARNEVGETEKTVYLDIQEEQTTSKKKKKERQNNVSGPVTCERNVCLNGGSCYFSSISGLQSCLCVAGWGGSRCEIPDDSAARSNVTERPDRSNTVLRQPVEARLETLQRESRRDFLDSGDSSRIKTPMSLNEGDHSRSSPSETTSHRQTKLPKPHREVQGQREAQTDNAPDSSDGIPVSKAQRPSPSVHRSSSNREQTGSDTDASESAVLDRDTVPLHRQTPSSTKTLTSVTDPQAAGKSPDHVTEDDLDVSVDEDTDDDEDYDENDDSGRSSFHDLSEIRSRLKKSRLKLLYCKEKRFCLNGGRCRYAPKLSIKFCQCPAGFSGSRCEVVKPG